MTPLTILSLPFLVGVLGRRRQAGERRYALFMVLMIIPERAHDREHCALIKSTPF